MDEKFLFAVDYKQRIIWLDGYITPKVGYKFERALIRLKKSGSGDVVFYVRGPGGDPYTTFYMMRLIGDSGLRVGCVAHDYVNSACFTLTQAGGWVAALPGTRFGFHRTVTVILRQEESEMTQAELLRELGKGKFIDSVQLKWFFSRGRRLEEIYDLFLDNADVSVPRAIKLGLVDKYFDRRDFLKDKESILKILKKGKRNKNKGHK